MTTHDLVGGSQDEVLLEARLRDALAPAFQLVGLLGMGGMSRVYLAREVALQRLVAVKVLAAHLADSTEARARFEREAQAVASLSHPHIVAIHAVGALADGTPYFVMQYVEGRSVAGRLQDGGPLPVREARRVLGEVASALAAAHAKGIIHRDIKPANVLFDEASGRVLVSDFGIAAVAPRVEQPDMRLTGTGMILGTPQYMSPEQLLAEPVSDKTDIYSLGLLAHEITVGTGPFSGRSPSELIAAHLRDTPPRLSDHRPEVDADLDALVARCLEKDAAARPTAAELARRLSDAAFLPWPPPGLESLHRRLGGATAGLMIGSMFVIAAVLPMGIGGASFPALFQSVVPILAAIGTIVGVAILAACVARLARLARLAAAAVRSGYGWRTVVETLADDGGDTGSLIAGARAYARLPAAARARLRALRIRAAVHLFAGSAALLPTAFGAVMLASRGVAGPWILWLPLVVGVLIAVAAIVTRTMEWRILRHVRVRETATESSTSVEAAATWNTEFDAARVGQGLGGGAAAVPAAGRLGAAIVAAVVTVALVTLFPLLIIGLVGPLIWTMALPQLESVRTRMEIAEVVRPFIPPRNRAITPMAAGEALWALQTPTLPSGGPIALRPPTVPLPTGAPWDDTMPSGLFPFARSGQLKGAPSELTILAAARAGFTPEERAYLRTLATAPHWTLFETVARAPVVDGAGARFVLPFTREASPHAVPIPRAGGTKALAYAAMSRAAFHLEAGRQDSAEAVLRDVIGFGFAVADNGNTAIEQLIGTVVIGIGRYGLIQFYEIVGDPRGRILKAMHDSAVATVEGADQALFASSPIGAGDPRSTRAEAVRIATTPQELRGLRAEMLVLLAGSLCTNVHDVIFGPGPDVASAFDAALATWARFPSDSAVVRLIASSTLRGGDVPDAHGRPTVRVLPQIAIAAAGVSGALLGNPRLRPCMAFLMQAAP